MREEKKWEERLEGGRRREREKYVVLGKKEEVKQEREDEREKYIEIERRKKKRMTSRIA